MNRLQDSPVVEALKAAFFLGWKQGEETALAEQSYEPHQNDSINYVSPEAAWPAAQIELLADFKKRLAEETPHG